MSDDESFDEFYAKFNDIVNYAFNLGEIYDQPKIVRKILRSLTEDFRPKVTGVQTCALPISVCNGVPDSLIDRFQECFHPYFPINIIILIKVRRNN